MTTFSLEVFPPKTERGLANLAVAVDDLTTTISPSYISVTYGAGGSSRDKSFAAIETARDHGNNTPIAAHLTCVGQSTGEIDDIVNRYHALGVRHVVALRGDPPEGIDAAYHPHADGYQRTADLVAAIRHRSDFEVTVSAYPERHPQSPSIDHDLDLLAEKIDAGATRAMTNMFFDNRFYYELVERAEARGLDIPIVPGVFPIHNFDSVSRFAGKSGASMPTAIANAFASIGGDTDAAFHLAAETAAAQIDDLLANGVEHIHLYTLNKSPLTLATLNAIGASA